MLDKFSCRIVSFKEEEAEKRKRKKKKKKKRKKEEEEEAVEHKIPMGIQTFA